MILNLTQHAATAEQIADGVVEPADKKLVQLNLTFENIPNMREIVYCAGVLAWIAEQSGAQKAMIGGAPYLMAPLERALRVRGVVPVYSFTRRETIEERLPDGGVKKTQVFRHAGWVEAVRAAAAIKRFKKALEMAETNGDTLGAEALRDCVARREARFETG